MSRRRGILYGSIFGISAIASFSSQQAACAQTAFYSKCVSHLISLGVSPNVAAQQCQQQTNNLPSCIDRLMYISARATSGPTEQGKWPFYQVYVPINGSAMLAAGCRLVSFLRADGWLCPQQEMRCQVMTTADAQAQCGGRAPAAQTLLNASGLIGSARTKFQHFFSGSQNQHIPICVAGQDDFDPIVVLNNCARSSLSKPKKQIYFY